MSYRSSEFDNERRPPPPPVPPGANAYRPDNGRDRFKEPVRRNSEQYSPGRRDNNRDNRPFDRGREYDAQFRQNLSLKTDSATLNAAPNHRGATVPIPRGTPTIPTAKHATISERSAVTLPVDAGPHANNPTRGIPPKARDISHQAILDKLFHFSDGMHYRSIYYAERNKKKKEMEAREAQQKLIRTKAADFPQQFDIYRMAKEKDDAAFAQLQDKYKYAEKIWVDYMQDLAAAIADSQKSNVPAPTASDDTISMKALEDRFSNFEKESTEARAKIAALESSQKESNEKVKKLEQECIKSDDRINLLESTVDDLEKINQNLTSRMDQAVKRSADMQNQLASIQSAIKDLDDLKTLADMPGRVDSLSTSVKTLESSGRKSKEGSALLTGKLESLDQRVKSLDGHIKSQKLPDQFKKLNASIEQLEKSRAAAMKAIEDIAAQKSSLHKLQESTASHADIAKVNNKMTQMETDFQQTSTGLGMLKRQLDELPVLGSRLEAIETDWDTMKDEYSSVVDAWVADEIPAKVMAHDQQLLQILQRSQSSLPAEEPTNMQTDIDDIKNAMKRRDDDVSATTKQIDELKAKFAPAMTKVVEMIEKMEKFLGGKVDDHHKRITTLEAQNIQARTPAATPQLESRASPAINELNLASRLQALEALNFQERLFVLSNLLEDATARINKNSAVYDNELRGIRDQLQIHAKERAINPTELRKILEQQDFSIQNLSHQLNHVNTRPWALEIVKMIEAHVVHLGPRMDTLEINFEALRQFFKINKQSWDKLQRVSQKRQASPRETGEDPNKRRKVSSNGIPSAPTRHNNSDS